MMKKTCFLFLLLCCGLALMAQDFEIVSVESLPLDMSAREEIHTDHNNRQCALLRIATQNIAPNQRELFNFVPDYGSEMVQRATRDGEIWLWVSPGLKYLRVKHRDWGQYELRLIDHVARVESLHTYKVTIKGTMVMALQEQNNNSPTQQYLVFQLSPTNAMLEVDGQLWEVAPDGTAMKFVNFGTYSYRVQAPNYLPETGKVTVDDPNNTKTVNVKLKSDFVEVTLKVDADAEIWVNNEKKGTRTWTGQLGKGTYKIECKQAGHETSMMTKEITAELNGQIIDLPHPMPIYGSLTVESMPGFATVFIDGKEVGETPKYVKEILADGHELKIVKEGYVDHVEIITINKDELKQMNIIMKRKGEQQTMAITNNISTDQTFTVNGVSFTMKFVEGATFQMGGSDNEAYSDEEPLHNVTLNGYYMGETEVTQSLWEAVMGMNPSYFKGENLPVERVSWNDCQEFLRKLNQKTGKNFRLPTEAEWEFAARGGKKSNGYKYSGSNTLREVAWFGQWDGETFDDGNSGERTHVVKTKLPNELGLYDMSGNVYERCSDWYADNYYRESPSKNPQGPSSGNYRVLRGGSWCDGAVYDRVSSRSKSDPYSKGIIIGFRLCLSE